MSTNQTICSDLETDFFVCLFFYVMKAECQQTLTSISGNFTSPNYPNIYPNNINCHWTITLSAGYRVKLAFPIIELEDQNSLTGLCDYDSVAVYDGGSDSDPLLGRWCGSDYPPSVLSKGNKLLVVLTTDRNYAFKGFLASYIGGECQHNTCTF